MSDKIKMAVLISGGGRTLANFLEKIERQELPARIETVISSKPNVKGLEIAQSANIPTAVITRKGKSIDEFSQEITQHLDKYEPELICLAGFMCFYRIPEHYYGKVMNIHPALLPSFGGKGMYGHYVHEAVLKAGCKISGCTVHFADNEYDHGPIIIQRAVPVMEEDTTDTLAARVFEQEKIAYPQAVKLFAEKRLKIIDGRVKILAD